MTYQEHYDKLIMYRKQNKLEKSKEHSGEIELHHILPRSCGGTDDPENIVNLYAKEHFMAHYYLWKIHENDEFRHQTLCAFWNMCVMDSPSQERTYQEYVNMSKEYQEARIQFAKYLSETMPSKVNGDKNGMRKLKWIKNPSTHEAKTWPKDMPLPDGWTYGRYQNTTEKIMKSRKKFISSVSGKRQIYNPSIGKLMYIGKNDPIPEGFRIGGKPMSDAAKQCRHQFYLKNTKEVIAPKRINELRPQYKFYCQNGWKIFQEKYNYQKTRPNFLQMCRTYLPEYRSGKCKAK